MTRFATLATLNVNDALPDAWVDEVKLAHDYLVFAGADIASAASIAITNEFHKVTGTTTITTITDALGQAKGQQITLQFVSAIQIGTSGNIQTLSGGTSFYGAGDVGVFVYDGTSKWVEVATGNPLDLNQTASQVMAGALEVGSTTFGPGANAGVYIDAAGRVQSTTGNVGNNAFACGLTTDSQFRATISTGGVITLGPGGATAPDLTLMRSAPGQLRIGGAGQQGSFKAGFNPSAPGLPATITPDAAYLVTRIAPINNSGALTVGAPTNPPTASESAILFVIIKAPAAGLTTITWNAAFAGGPPTTLGASSGIICLFVWDGGTSKWQMIVSFTE